MYEEEEVKMHADQERISLKNAVRLKSAEFWLKLGHPVEALVELQRLPQRTRKHPWARQVCRSVYRAF